MDGQLADADPERIVAEILAVADAPRPQAILTYGPDGVSGHPDHVAIGRFAAEVFRRTVTIAALYTLAVPQTLATTLGMTQIHTVPDAVITHTVDVAAAWAAKIAAIHCHRTQLGEAPILRVMGREAASVFGHRALPKDASPPRVVGYARAGHLRLTILSVTDRIACTTQPSLI